ncbi:MAG: MarR family transcriptional regulator [Prolixibacteraceae bacterium]|nr:MarR family transcriptional regulator [Prolixibacteraceae bacterium]
METNRQLGYFLNKTLRIFKSQINTEFRKQGIELTFEQFVVLRMLDSNCNMIQQDLAHVLQKDKSIIVRQMNGLLDEKYVDRLTNTNDKRKKNLTLTSKGIEILEQLKLISNDLSDRLLAGVTESEYETFKKVMLKIQENGVVEE